VEFLCPRAQTRFRGRESNQDILAAVDLVIDKLKASFAATKRKSRTAAVRPRQAKWPAPPALEENSKE